MALSMPSRFAVLKIEDDDFRPQNSNKNKEKKKPVESKPIKKSEKSAEPSNKKANKKKDKKKNENPEQWEQWKAKDSEYVDGSYEQDLQNAILLSKLDYEEKKNVYKQNKKDAEIEKKEKENDKKKKKNKSMSLEQFNSMVTKTNDGNDTSQPQEPEVKSDTQFFERINAEAKEVVSNEQIKEKTKTVNKKILKQFNDETITISQLQEKLEKQKAENRLYKEELDKCKKEILAVKDRNKTLCGILAHGEMKDKADVLIELDRLSRVKDELTEEVARLHGLLEQERSKVSALTSASNENSSHNSHNNHNHNHNHNTHGKKEKNKKRPSDNNVQQ